MRFRPTGLRLVALLYIIPATVFGLAIAALSLIVFIWLILGPLEYFLHHW